MAMSLIVHAEQVVDLVLEHERREVKRSVMLRAWRISGFTPLMVKTSSTPSFMNVVRTIDACFGVDGEHLHETVALASAYGSDRAGRPSTEISSEYCAEYCHGAYASFPFFVAARLLLSRCPRPRRPRR